MRERTVLLTAAVVCATATVAPVAPARAQPSVTLTARLARMRITFGQSTTVSGGLTAGPLPLAGRTVTLEASPFPFKTVNVAGTAVTGPDGSYSIRAAPDRNTFYRVVSAPPFAAQSAALPTIVDERVAARVRYLSLGRVRIALSTAHPRDLAWGRRRARWFLAEGSSARFRPVRVTRTTQGRAGVTRLSADFPLAAGRFRYLVCFSAPDQFALDLPAAHGRRCQRRAFTLKNAGGLHVTASDFAGRGSAPVGFPFPGRVAAGRRYLAHRGGLTAFAVVDSEGRMSGFRSHTRFVSASVVKGMLLVAYLRKLAARHRGLDSGSRGILYPMIHVSDNGAATSVYRRVGDGGLYGLAHRAGMTDFSVAGFWANAQISAADQARFFFGIDGLIPRRFRGYARGLLAGIAGYESWGIPRVARPHWHVLFKGGWRGTGRGQLVHQVARLERRGGTFAMAVMTDGDPSMGYGISTIQGLTARLVGGRLPRPSRIRTLGPGG